jgi:uncharacterized metal-binding protein
MTIVVLRPLPVLYACAGCSEFGYSAPRVANALDARGVVECIWLGATPPPSTVSGRYPIITLDACEKACAMQWVRKHGRTVERACFVKPQERDDPPTATARIAAELAPRFRGGNDGPAKAET